MTQQEKFLGGPDRSRWHRDGLHAVLLNERDGYEASLEVRNWYEDQSREPVVSWVVSWAVPGGLAPYIYEAAFETPALVADSDARRSELATKARAALSRPRLNPPTPFEQPASKPADADAWSSLLGRQISCWVDSFDALLAALNSNKAGVNYTRYRSAVEALGWAYTVDSSLTVLWNTLDPADQEAESVTTDQQASAAIINNAKIVPGYSVNADGPFHAYLRRQTDGKPYARWSDVMLAGMFQSNFFGAITWVRGHMVHAATEVPIELRQHRPGSEPRWKFSPSVAFARGRSKEAARVLYDQVLAGNDVLGLMGPLADVFVNAELRLVERLRATAS